MKCKKVAVINNVAYHYRQREDSMLKQSAGYGTEAQKLRYLYEYMSNWSKDTDADLNLRTQVIDYVLSIAIIRSGGRLLQDDYSTFDAAYYNKAVVIYSAGTFGQQLVNRFLESGHCDIVAWIDDDYWEYRRCCLDVDPVESIVGKQFDYILIASVDSAVAETVLSRLADLGVSREKMLTITVPEDKEQLLGRFLDVKAIKTEEEKNKRGMLSHV